MSYDGRSRSVPVTGRVTVEESSVSPVGATNSELPSPETAATRWGASLTARLRIE